MSQSFNFTKKIKALIFILIIFFSPSQAYAQEEMLEGKILDISTKEEILEGQIKTYHEFDILVTKGSLKDERIKIETGSIENLSQQNYDVHPA